MPKATIGQTFKKLIYNKKFLIIISVVISVVVWFVAAIERNPVRTKEFTDISASITLKGTVAEQNSLSIISDTSNYKFTVTVKGPSYIVSTLRKDDFVLKADVSKITEPMDNCVLKIEPFTASGKTGYEFVSVEPSTVTVKVDRIASQEFDLIPRVSKTVLTDTKNNFVAEKPQLTDLNLSKVVIDGPVTTLAKIKSVVAIADYDGSLLQKTTAYDSQVVLLDADNNVVYKYDTSGALLDANGNKIDNPEITLRYKGQEEYVVPKVTVAIAKKATLKVNAVFNNNNSKKEIEYTVDPSKATVIGPPDIVSKMTAIDLKAIDFTKISSDYSNRVFKVTADLPETVKFEGDDSNKTVFTVRVTRIRSKR